MNVAPSTGASAGLDPQALSALAKALAQVPVEAGTAPASPTTASPPTRDEVVPSLPELTNPALQELLRVVDERVFPVEPRLEVQLDFQPRAEGVRAPGPARAQSFRAHAYAAQTPGQSPEAALVDARESAVRSIGKAARAVEMADVRGSRVPDRAPEGVDPRTVLTLANQFIETAQLANYLRAEELGRLVSFWFEGSQPRPFSAGRTSAALKATQGRQSSSTLSRLWGRAPLLVLFAAWLSSGLMAALVLRLMDIRAWENTMILDIWAGGFLALVVFQFVATIRGALRMRAR